MGDTKEKRVVDIDATRVVQRKADDMRKAFKNWIFKDPARREAIVQKYKESVFLAVVMCMVSNIN